MKNKRLIYAGITLIGIILVYLIFFGGNKEESNKYNDFATCLTEEGVVMYGTEWCSFCQKQKDYFGESFKLINFVDCDTKKQDCLAAGIKGYPTWVIKGAKYSGVQSLERLSELSSCELT